MSECTKWETVVKGDRYRGKRTVHEGGSSEHERD